MTTFEDREELRKTKPFRIKTEGFQLSNQKCLHYFFIGKHKKKPTSYF